MAQEKLDELESIRGIAALLVVFVHIPKWAGFFDVPMVESFALMVDLFFVLSGFVIFRAYSQRLRTPRDVARFQFLRLARLYPVHLMFLLAYLLLELSRLYAVQTQGVSLAAEPFSHNTPARLLQHVFLVQALPPHSETSFNAPSWSISVEFYTYLLFAVLLLMTKRWAVVVFAGTAAAAVGSIATDLTGGMGPLLRCWAGFFVGCLTASAYEKHLHDKQLPAVFPLLALIGMGLYIALRPVTESGIWIYALSAALILCVLCSKPGLVRNALKSRVLVLLGTFSYSMYMAHHLLIAVFEIVMNRVLRMPPGTKPAGGYIAVLTPAEAVVSYVVFFSLLLALCAAVYRFVERPCREASRRAVGAKRAASPVAATVA